MNTSQYAEAFKRELPAFREMTEKFYRQEVSVKDYKGFSGRYGSYAQRGGKASMLRLRLTCGRIDKEQLEFIADVIERYHIDKVHFTTCQSLQLHDLSGEAACAIMEEAISHGILSWGGGGDFPRNVMASPLSGVEPGEHFDVFPYAQATADYLMRFITEVKLPRKLKVCFSNSPANEPHATFRDLGFVATAQGAFDVYSAGGLGMNPKKGLCVARDVPPNEILYYVKAMVNTFLAYGNYENRAKARTRYMQDTLGQEGYIRAYQEKLVETLSSGENLTLSVTETPITKAGDGGTISHSRILSQKQPGLYTVAYHPIGGTPAPSKLGELSALIRDMEDVELRLGPDGTLYIVNCTSGEAGRVLDATADGAQSLFETSVACIGASICQVGLRDSQKLLRELVEAIRPCRFADGVLPRLRISGCPSSCGAHQVGSMAFRGGSKLVNKKPVVAFNLFVGGSDGQGQEQFAEDWGAMAQTDIPAFLIDVGNAVTAQHTTFERWLPGHRDELRAIAAKYQG